jgi:hypothetical protein
VLGITPGVDIRDLMKSLKINSKDRQTDTYPIIWIWLFSNVLTLSDPLNNILPGEQE